MKATSRSKLTIDFVNGLQQVVDAKVSGTLFRGFETILRTRSAGRTGYHPAHLRRLPRIARHGRLLALESGWRKSRPDNARIMRNLVLGRQLHPVAHPALLPARRSWTIIDGPAMAPWQPSWHVGHADQRRRASAGRATTSGARHAPQGARDGRPLRRQAAASAAFMPGGFTATPTAERITTFRTYLDELIAVHRQRLPPGRGTAARRSTPTTTPIGRGCGNLLAYGVFDLDATGQKQAPQAAAGSTNGGTAVQPWTSTPITEQVTLLLVRQTRTNNLNPAAGATTAQHPQDRAPTPGSRPPATTAQPYEVGPLARMWVNGDYRNGISVMDRHWPAPTKR